MRIALVILGLAVGAMGAGTTFAQTAGVIQFVAGDVKLVLAGGSERAARKGVPVSVGDTLATANGGLAQLKMGDGAIVVVQPETRLTVAEFHYAGVEDGTEKVRYRLERGGFRAVTGAIGRTHKQNYLIETPIAHMGVRGTDHESYYFPAMGPVGGDDAKPGAYNKVNTGRTFIRTGAGEVEIDPNEVGYVASAGELPVILPTVPGFFNRSIAPRARPATKPAPAVAELDHVQLDHVQQQQMVDNGVRLVRTRGPRVTPGSGNGPLAGWTLASGGASFGGSGNGVALEDNGALRTNEVTNAPFGVNWFTWEGGVATVDGQATSGTTHVIDSSMKTSASELTALTNQGVIGSYSYVSGPAPTNGTGMSGTINSLDVTANFGTQMITSYALDATVDTTNWTASGSGSISAFTGRTGILLSGSCAGCTGAPSSPASGTAHGTFVGTNAEGLITTFGMSSGGGQSLSGAAALTR